MDTEKLELEITANASKATPEVSGVMKLVGQLENMLGLTSRTGQQHGERLAAGAQSARRGMDSAREGADSLGAGVARLGEHYRMATAGLQVFNLEATAGATKVAALGDVIGGLGRAAPALLALGTILSAAAASFTFLSEAIKEAANSERTLVTIGALIRNQGTTDWREQARQVDEYAASLARAGSFAKSDYLSGMQAMLALGVSLNDTLRSQSAAQEIARARGISLVDAENALANAYNNRLREMTRMGIVSREEAKAGIDYEVILQRISARMGGTAAADLTTFAGKWDNLHNLVGLVREDFGTALLPVLDAFVDTLRNTASAAQPLADQFREWVGQHLPELRAGAEGFGQALSALAVRVLPAVETALEETMGWLSDLGRSLTNNENPIKGFTDGLTWAKNVLAGFKSAVDDFNRSGQPLADMLNAMQKAAEANGRGMHEYIAAVDSGKQPTDELTAFINSLDKELSLLPQALSDVVGWLGKIPDAAHAAGSGLVDAFRTAFGWAKDLVDQIGLLIARTSALAGMRPWPNSPADLITGGAGGGPAGMGPLGQQGYISGITPVASANVEDAMRTAVQRYGNNGVDPATLATLLRAVGMQESGLGTSSQYDALTGRSRQAGNLGRGKWQLDPSSGATPDLLNAVSIDDYRAAGEAARMLADNLRAANGNVTAALAMYNAGPAHWMSPKGLEYAQSVLKFVPAGGAGPTQLALAQGAAHGVEPRAGGPRTTASTHHIEGTSGAGKQPFEPGLLDAAIDKTNVLKLAQEALMESLARLTASEQPYRAAVDLATDSEQKAEAQRRLQLKVTDDAFQSMNRLDEAISRQLVVQAALAERLGEDTSARDAAIASANRYAESLRGQTDVTSTQHRELSNLVKTAHERTAQVERDNALVQENTSQLDSNRKARLAAEAASRDAAKSEAALAFAYNDGTRKLREAAAADVGTYGKSILDQLAYWNERIDALDHGSATYRQHLLEFQTHIADLNRQERDQQIDDVKARRAASDDLAIYGGGANAVTLQEKLDAIASTREYYAERLALIRTAGTDEFNEARGLQQKLDQLDVDAQKARIDAATAFQKTWEDREAGWIEGLVNRTKSLRDTLKDVFGSIVGDFVKMFARMVVESSGMQSVTAEIAKLFHVDLAPGMAGKSNAEAAQLTDSIRARTATETRAGSATQARTSAEEDATSATESETTAVRDATAAVESFAARLNNSTAGGGGGNGAGGLQAPDFWQNGIPGFNGGDINVTGADSFPGLSDPTVLSQANIAAIGGLPIGPGGSIDTNIAKVGGEKAAGPTALGRIMGGMMVLQGMQTVGQGGGGLSTGLQMGLGAFQATGNPYIAAAAALYGTFAGPHWGPVSNYPDRDPAQSQTFGQLQANWVGTSGMANGTNYIAEQKYNVSQGGTPLYKQMEQWANSLNGNTASLNAAQKLLYDQVLKLEGGNPNADFGFTSLHNGVWTTANGQQISYQDALAMANSFSANAGSVSSTPVYTVSRAHPDFNLSTSSQTGTFVTNANAGQTGAQPGAVGGGTVSAPTVQVNVNAPNSTFVNGGMDDLAQQLSATFGRQFTGQAPGAVRNYQQRIVA